MIDKHTDAEWTAIVASAEAAIVTEHAAEFLLAALQRMQAHIRRRPAYVPVAERRAAKSAAGFFGKAVR